MRALALGVLLTVTPSLALGQPTGAPAPRRGFLTGLGISLFVVSLAGGGLAVAGLHSGGEARALLNQIPIPPPESDAPVYRALEAQISGAAGLTVAGFVLAGLSLAGGILCIALDGRPVSVAFAPTREGGLLAVKWNF